MSAATTPSPSTKALQVKKGPSPLPEGIICAVPNPADGVLRHLANQGLGERLVVADLQRALRGLVLLQLLSESFQSPRHEREIEVRLVRREGEQEARLDEERGVPLDLLLGLRRGLLEDCV